LNGGSASPYLKTRLNALSDGSLNELYSDWHQEKFEAYKQVVGYEGHETTTEELLLMNFDNGQLKLF
jgi:hypothetical protein